MGSIVKDFDLRTIKKHVLIQLYEAKTITNEMLELSNRDLVVENRSLKMQLGKLKKQLTK